MRFEEDGFDPTPYDRILGGIHTPAREYETEEPEAIENIELVSEESFEEALGEECEEKAAEAEEIAYERVSLIDDEVVIPMTCACEKLIPLDDEVIVSRFDYTDKLEEKSVVITAEEDFLVPDIKPDMAKILSIDGYARVDEREIRTVVSGRDSISVSGEVTLKTLYIPENGKGDPVITIQSRMPFKSEVKVDVPEMATGYVSAYVENIEYTVINERKFRVNVTLRISVCQNVKKTLGFFEGLRSEEVELLKEKITLVDVIQRKRDTISINETIVLKDGAPEPVQIVKCDIRTVENSRQVTSDKAVINASIYYSILYLGDCESEEGIVTSMPLLYQGKAEFTQFITLGGDSGCTYSRVTFDDSDITVKIKNRYEEKKTQGEYDDDIEEGADDEETEISAGPGFVISGSVETTIEVFGNLECEIATDVYHSEKEMVFESVPFDCCEYVGSGNCDIPVREVISVPDGHEEIERIIFGTGKVSALTCSSEYGKAILTGYLDVELLALEGPGLRPGRLCQRIPLRINIDIPSARSGMSVSCEASVRELRCEKIGTNQVEISASVYASCSVCNSYKKALITKPAFVCENNCCARKPGMVVYVVKQGDCLWGIAKEFRVSVEKIKAVNCLDEQERLPEGKRLLIVR